MTEAEERAELDRLVRKYGHRGEAKGMLSGEMLLPQMDWPSMRRVGTDYENYTYRTPWEAVNE